MLTPEREDFKKLAGDHNMVPVYKEIIGDTVTPVSAFAKLAGGRYAFLLESAERGERFGRYSFLGTEPAAVLEAVGNTVFVRDRAGAVMETLDDVVDPLTVIKERISDLKPARLPTLPSFSGGAIGYLGYDAVRRYERLPGTQSGSPTEPDMVFMLTDELLIFDHLKHRIKVVVNARVGEDPDAAYDAVATRIDALAEKLTGPEPEIRPLDAGAGEAGTCRSNMSADNFKDAVERAKEYVRAGDVLQVVLSQRLETECPADPFDVYRALRTINPAPYMYYLKLNGTCLAGSSPEPLVKVEGDSVMTRPIAGTKPRGASDAEDEAAKRALLADVKERPEHVMLVDLGRNDLSRVCLPGSVRVERFMRPERFSHITHLISEVVGELQPGTTPFDLLRACFPAGTVSGAPKVRAMQIISELEGYRRGVYAGAVGYFDPATSSMDTCIAIRSLTLSGGVAHLQAGAGLVADSDPASEHEECLNKLAAVEAAIELAEAER